MHLKQLALILCICIMWRHIVADEDKGSLVDPTDLLNFDPVNIKMRRVADDHHKKRASIPRQEEKITPKSSIPLKPNNNSNQINRKDALNDNNHCPKPGNEALESIFKRHLMFLVQHIDSRIDSTDMPVEFCMKMKASYNDLMLIKSYGTGNTFNIHEVNEKLEKMFIYATDLPNHSPIYWLEMRLGLSPSVLLMIAAIILLSIVTAKMLISVRISKSFFIKGIVFAFLFSTVTTYIELYQQKVAHQEKILTDQLSERCPHLSDSMWSRFTNYVTSSVTFQDESCREYHEAMVVNPIFKVSVLEAGAMAVVKTVVAPMKIIGSGVKDFIVGLFKDLPSQYAFFLTIIMLILSIIFPFVKSGYTLRIPFLLTLQAPQIPPLEHQEKQKLTELIDGFSQLSLKVDGIDERPSLLPSQQSALECNTDCKPDSKTQRKMTKTPCQDEEKAVNKDNLNHSDHYSCSQESYRSELLTCQDVNQDDGKDAVIDLQNAAIDFEDINQHEGCADDSSLSNPDFFLAQEDRTVDKDCDSDMVSQTKTKTLDIDSNNSDSIKPTDSKNFESKEEV